MIPLMRRTSLAAVALVLALTACSRPASEGPRGTGSLAPSSDSSVPASLTASTGGETVPPLDLSDPVVAALPAAARAKTSAGAIAFGRFYVTQLGAMFAGKEVIRPDKLTTPDCTVCRSLLKETERLRAQGLTRANPASLKYSGIDFSSTEREVVRVEVVMRPLKAYDASGNYVGHIMAGVGSHMQLRMDLQYQGHWRVVELRLTQ